MSTLRSWLVSKDYDPAKGLCICVGTDGLKIANNEVMSISVAGISQEPEIIYIKGADALSVYDYTGVHPNRYEEQAVGIGRARELLMPIINKSEFLITYTASRFTRPWLEKCIPELVQTKEYLDMINICKSLDQGYPIGYDVADIYSLESRLDSSFFMVRDGYRFDDVCHRAGALEFPELPTLESRIYRLFSLYLATLDRL